MLSGERKLNSLLPFCYPTEQQSMTPDDTGWTFRAKLLNETGSC
jgi:hypothetical protein